MPNKHYAAVMARYNPWQNESPIKPAGAKLGDADIATMPAKFQAM